MGDKKHEMKALTSIDILVCGGGPAGIFAALAAAQSGRSTLLVESSGRLGGAGVNAMVNQIWLATDTPFVRDIFERDLHGHLQNSEFLDLAYTDLIERNGAELLLHAPVFAALTHSGSEHTVVTGVHLATSQGPLTVEAGRVIDATGDGTVAFLAGATFEYGRVADGRVQPVTIMFRVSGVHHEKSMEANGGRNNYPFPEGGWDHHTMAAHARGELPSNVGKVRTYLADRPGDRYINATQINDIDGTSIFDLTRAELEARRQVTPIMDFLRAHAPGFKEAYVSGMPASVGVRETRRFKCQKTQNREDCLNGRTFPDAVCSGCTAPLDIHNPAGPGQATGTSDAHPAGRDPVVQPYDIPYDCLVPEATDSLLLAGRCIGGTHEAHASYRFQTICMATGAAAGFAAAASLKQNCQPRAIDLKPVQTALGIVRNAEEKPKGK